MAEHHPGKEKVSTVASLREVINARPPPTPRPAVYALKQSLEFKESAERLAAFLALLLINSLGELSPQPHTYRSMCVRARAYIPRTHTQISRHLG